MEGLEGPCFAPPIRHRCLVPPPSLMKCGLSLSPAPISIAMLTRPDLTLPSAPAPQHGPFCQHRSMDVAEACVTARSLGYTPYTLINILAL